MGNKIINENKSTLFRGKNSFSYKRLMQLRNLQLKALVNILQKRNVLSEEEVKQIIVD